MDSTGTSWWTDFWNKLGLGIEITWNNFVNDSKIFFLQVGSVIYNVPIKIGQTATSLIENLSVSAGFGIGIGLDLSLFGLINIAAIYKFDPISFVLDRTGMKFGGSAEKSLGFNFFKIFTRAVGIEEFFKYRTSNPIKKDKKFDVSIGVGGYFIFGAQISFALNFENFWKELKEIWT